MITRLADRDRVCHRAFSDRPEPWQSGRDRIRFGIDMALVHERTAPTSPSAKGNGKMGRV
ncbi:MAG: hypothetical protein IGR92_03735 [Leptolyngbyaceae cyanobacterium T60_A2020_046]|nr:hypothetical protein [Leptolyngbyaceae cyanobacterium T60_A2020_046]